MQYNINIRDVVKIAKETGELAMSFYDKKYTVEEKENKTPVTEADILINDYLIKKLLKYGYPILSEELKDEFEKRKNAEFVWIIDPLDGTSDFIQKTKEFSIMIGLVNKSGESVLGVVYAPALNELYYAERGKGAFLLSKERKENFFEIDFEKAKKICVSQNPIQNGKILVSGNHLGEYEQKIAKKYAMRQISMGSAGLKICRIAKGGAELYINSSDKSGLWDVCAGDIILREAGGCIKDKKGSEILYNKKNIVLRNGYIILNVSKDL